MRRRLERGDGRTWRSSMKRFTFASSKLDGRGRLMMLIGIEYDGRPAAAKTLELAGGEDGRAVVSMGVERVKKTGFKDWEVTKKDL